MNYELAKQLKDAGFPVREWKTDDLLEKWNFYPPTLSELIESCGDMLGDLTRTDIGWITNNENSDGSYEGSTPEEAVANLWLALNKK